MEVGLFRHMTLKVREPPGDRDTESGRRRRVPALELGECFLQLPLTSPEIIRHHPRGDDGVMERRHDDRDAVVADHGYTVE
ncbi:MAG: hypothetical protein E6G33_07605 [Actinobacteria bacterium]|nr:MAG: hypothetical protein E6G33_07605 [Actinomycetota bacterium]